MITKNIKNLFTVNGLTKVIESAKLKNINFFSEPN